MSFIRNIDLTKPRFKDETFNQIGLFEKEKAFYKAYLACDEELMVAFLKEGVSVGPITFPVDKSKEYSKTPQNKKWSGVLGGALIDGNERVVNLLWERADFKNHGLDYLNYAIFGGSEALVQKVLDEFKKQKISLDSSKEANDDIDKNFFKIKHCFNDVLHRGPNNQSHLSDKVFDQVVLYLKENDLSWYEFFWQNLSNTHYMFQRYPFDENFPRPTLHMLMSQYEVGPSIKNLLSLVSFDHWDKALEYYPPPKIKDLLDEPFPTAELSTKNLIATGMIHVLSKLQEENADKSHWLHFFQVFETHFKDHEFFNAVFEELEKEVYRTNQSIKDSTQKPLIMKNPKYSEDQKTEIIKGLAETESLEKWVHTWIEEFKEKDKKSKGFKAQISKKITPDLIDKISFALSINTQESLVKLNASLFPRCEALALDRALPIKNHSLTNSGLPIKKRI